MTSGKQASAGRESLLQRMGVPVGVCFCVLALVNQIAIGRQALPMAGGLTPGLALSIVYWFSALSVALHALVWMVYAALVTAVGRVCFDGASRPVRFSDLFTCVGCAHIPLVLWTLSVALAWSGGIASLAEVERVLQLQLATRLGAYGAALVLLTVHVSARFQVGVGAAAIATCLPAAGIMLVLGLLNVGATVLIGSH